VNRIGPDELASLEDERDFLLRSLDDLERERAAGDVDDDDYRTLKDDYTARAADVLRSIEAGHAALRAAPPVSASRRLATIVGIVLVAGLAGLLVAQASGRRGGGSLSGLDVTAASSRLSDCQADEREGEVDAALACYGEVLDALPANVEALTFRGWLQVREFDVDDGLADLDAAVQLDPSGTAPYLFRASGRARAGDTDGALADLASFQANDPPEDQQQLFTQLGSAIVDRVLDACIADDVDGSGPLVDVFECYRGVLEIDREHPTANAYLGWLLARSGADDQLALQHLDRAVAADPELTQALVFRAALRARLGDRQGALADLEAFDAAGTAPREQVAAAAQVRSALEAGRDPMA